MERFLYYFIFYGLPLLAGLGLGSFFSVLIYRLPRGESIVRPGSHCPACAVPLKARHNIPVVSYLFLGGRCGFCKTPIPIRYPLLEAGTALLVLLLSRAPLPATEGTGIIAHCLVVGALALVIPITAIDAAHGIIPHTLTLGGMAAAVAAAFFPGGVTPLQMLAGAAAGGGVLWVLSQVTLLAVPRERRVDGSTVGGGDIMMLTMYGALLGPVEVLAGLGAGAVLGLAYVVLFRLKKREEPFPFGPFLAAGILLSAVWGRAFLGWYIGLF